MGGLLSLTDARQRHSNSEGSDSQMLFVCSKCATAYRAEPSVLGRLGRRVRCGSCRHVQFLRNPEVLPAVARAYRAEVEALCAALSIEQLVKASAARIGNPAPAGSDAVVPQSAKPGGMPQG
jgi:predicted Zn finger-like uncharacterized protein